jgi:hypothetical protein
MSWSRYIENPDSLALLGAAAEDFRLIELHELVVHRDGPLLRLRFDVPFVPEQLPVRWPAEANTTQITLAAWGIGDLSLTGWATSVRGLLCAVDDGNVRVLRFNGESCAVRVSYTALRVENVSGYVNELMANRASQPTATPPAKFQH